MMAEDNMHRSQTQSVGYLLRKEFCLAVLRFPDLLDDEPSPSGHIWPGRGCRQAGRPGSFHHGQEHSSAFDFSVTRFITCQHFVVHILVERHLWRNSVDYKCMVPALITPIRPGKYSDGTYPLQSPPSPHGNSGG